MRSPCGRLSAPGGPDWQVQVHGDAWRRAESVLAAQRSRGGPDCRVQAGAGDRRTSSCKLRSQDNRPLRGKRTLQKECSVGQRVTVLLHGSPQPFLPHRRRCGRWLCAQLRPLPSLLPPAPGWPRSTGQRRRHRLRACGRAASFPCAPPTPASRQRQQRTGKTDPLRMANRTATVAPWTARYQTNTPLTQLPR